MSCSSNPQFNLIKQYPEKAAELDRYIDGLGLTEDREKNRGFLIQCLHKA